MDSFNGVSIKRAIANFVSYHPPPSHVQTPPTPATLNVKQQWVQRHNPSTAEDNKHPQVENTFRRHESTHTRKPLF